MITLHSTGLYCIRTGLVVLWAGSRLEAELLLLQWGLAKQAPLH
jgi:hypothetical protein